MASVSVWKEGHSPIASSEKFMMEAVPDLLMAREWAEPRVQSFVWQLASETLFLRVPSLGQQRMPNSSPGSYSSLAHPLTFPKVSRSAQFCLIEMKQEGGPRLQALQPGEPLFSLPHIGAVMKTLR